MVTAQYDQRFVRRDGKVFRSAASGTSLCDVCGDAPRCQIKHGLEYQSATWSVETTVSACGVFMPVLMFKDDTGLNRPLWNTFRRGGGWFNRVDIGTRVRMFASGIEEFVGEGVVSERHAGALGPLLEQHAAMNHLLIGNLVGDADAQLWRILVALYGRNYAAPTEEFSVLYVEGKQQ